MDLVWHKSSFSAGDADCVEVAWPADTAALRDSKNPDAGLLTLPATALHHLTMHIVR